MSAFSDYLETQIANWINGSSFAPTLTGGTFVQLYTQDPTDEDNYYWNEETLNWELII